MTVTTRWCVQVPGRPRSPALVVIGAGPQEIRPSSGLLCSSLRAGASRSNNEEGRGLSEESVTHMNSALMDLFVQV